MTTQPYTRTAEPKVVDAASDARDLQERGTAVTRA